MPRSYVTAIETNLKLGGSAKLGPRTLVIGRNCSGKSTIVNAIEAAGSGRVSDVAGRATLAKGTELSMLGSSETLFAKAVLSDGQTALWGLERGHLAKRTGPEIAFPLRAAREALLGEPDKARRWILQNGGGVEWDDVEQLIPDTLRPRLRKIPWDETTAPDAASRLAQALDETKRRVREQNARARNKPAAPGSPPPTDAEIKAAEALVASLTDAARFGGATRRLVELGDQAPALKQRIEVTTTAIAQLRRERAALPPSAPISEIVRAALLVAEMLAGNKATECIICGSKTSAAVFAKRAEFARAKIDGAIKTDAARQELDKRITDAERALDSDRRQLAANVEEEKRLRELVGAGGAGAGSSGPGPGASPTSPEEARRALTEMHALRAGWKLCREAETEALQAQQDALAWDQLATALSGALGQLVERARGKFEARVQAFLPKGWTFGVDLLDGDREVLRVGLRVGAGSAPGQTQLRSALSGAEWATVTAALALATAPKDGPVVIAPEERAFDPDTLTAVLRAFGSVVNAAQVVMTSPVAPTLVPAGWTVVQVGEAEAEDPGAEVSAGEKAEAVAVWEAALAGESEINPPAPKQRGPGRPRRDGTPAQPRNSPDYVPPPPEPKELAEARKPDRAPSLVPARVDPSDLFPIDDRGTGGPLAGSGPEAGAGPTPPGPDSVQDLADLLPR